MIIQKFEELIDNCIENSIAVDKFNKLNCDQSDITGEFFHPFQELKSSLHSLITKYMQNLKIKQGPFASHVEVNVQS